MSETPTEGGGVRISTNALKPELPKRFYKDVSVGEADGQFRILLDGRSVKTPAKRILASPTRALAGVIAEEWAAVGERINPDLMPVTRIMNSALDAVAFRMEEVREDIVRFSGSDLLCYRARDPDTLVQRQHAHWDPILLWAATELGAGFVTSEGIMPVAQSDEATGRVRSALEGLQAVELSALHVMTALLGSALLALAHLKGRITADQAWAAAHVDDTYQAEMWGRDEEAEMRAAIRRRDFDAAARMLALV